MPRRRGGHARIARALRRRARQTASPLQLHFQPQRALTHKPLRRQRARQDLLEATHCQHGPVQKYPQRHTRGRRGRTGEHEDQESSPLQTPGCCLSRRSQTAGTAQPLERRGHIARRDARRARVQRQRSDEGVESRPSPTQTTAQPPPAQPRQRLASPQDAHAVSRRMQMPGLQSAPAQPRLQRGRRQQSFGEARRTPAPPRRHSRVGTGHEPDLTQALLTFESARKKKSL